MTCEHDFFWHADPANECGWKCISCGWQPGEPPGFSPSADRELLDRKIFCIVDDLHNSAIIYVANGEMGSALVRQVAQACRERELYDSVSIARLVLEVQGDDKHAKFWRDTSNAILAGNDTRARCYCGALARTWAGDRCACCLEHMNQQIRK